MTAEPARKGAHTPGPWTVKMDIGKLTGGKALCCWIDGNATTIDELDGERVQVMVGELQFGNAGDEANAANARLIAEAPAMKEALRSVIDDGFETYSAGIDGEGIVIEGSTIAMIRAILARIDGEGGE